MLLLVGFYSLEVEIRRPVGKALFDPFPQIDTSSGLGRKHIENILGKGEIACTSNFSFSQNVFYSIKDINYHFCYI